MIPQGEYTVVGRPLELQPGVRYVAAGPVIFRSRGGGRSGALPTLRCVSDSALRGAESEQTELLGDLTVMALSTMSRTQ